MQPIVRAHPDDVDVVVLYTEAAMLTHPIGASLWPRADAPANIAEARQRLEQVLAGHRDHIGAIHFYIHLMEDSPEWALAMPQAEKLAGSHRAPDTSSIWRRTSISRPVVTRTPRT